ncbi:RNA polymerase sigma factor [Steroidobacter sp.]|uniref:RNA polymerase sigma factor n=1 Tax=Steroidobacter sp. TaxID=1978227 RepID=UPI001A632CC6|nr:RNA polymerase sigma factor [Steroidobacter sp.]MBL8270847.1 RNA polymerase sigma factor [Steroidobacter sp.]
MSWILNNVRRLHQVLRRRGWKRHDAEDVIQDAFLRMQTYCNEGGEVRNSEAFLVRTALNLSFNARSRKPDEVMLAPSDSDEPLQLHFEPAPDEVLEAEQSLDQVIALIDAMTPRTREIFLLHYVEGFTYPQIARQLSISVSAVEKHMARAMLALTQELPV